MAKLNIFTPNMSTRKDTSDEVHYIKDERTTPDVNTGEQGCQIRFLVGDWKACWFGQLMLSWEETEKLAVELSTAVSQKIETKKEAPQNGIFRLLVQSREADKWKGKDWIYLTPGQARDILVSLGSNMLSGVLARILEPAMGAFMKSILGKKL